MHGVLWRRWATAVGTLVALTLSLVMPASAQTDQTAEVMAATAKAPTQAEIRAEVAEFVKRLPPPGAKGSQPMSTTLRSGGGTGPSVRYAFTCVGRSSLKIVGVQNFNYVVAQSTTGECAPAAMDFIAAQTWLVQWLPDVQKWVEVMPGNYDGHPGTSASSTTFEYSCSMNPTNYGAVGYHYARGGPDSAVGYTFAPGSSSCTLRP